MKLGKKNTVSKVSTSFLLICVILVVAGCSYKYECNYRPMESFSAKESIEFNKPTF